MKKLFFKTFGCRTNIFDTEVMIKNIGEFINTDKIEEADYIIVNSCTVTNSADTNTRQFINRAKREFPNAEIFFTGCGISGEGLKLYNSGIVKSAFGHSEKAKISEILKNNERRYIVGDLNYLDKTVVDNFSSHSRAFIKIQEGCDFKCNYCIIPAVRGSARSYPENYILEQIKILANNGFGEIILTGTNIGSYININIKSGKNNSLANLLKKIAEIRGVRRIRLGSVEPSQITPEFIELLDEKFMGKYLHIAIQYADNNMLKIMNRRNRVENDIKLFEKLAMHGYAIGTDFIVGHPGEDEVIFKSAFENLRNNYPLTHIHLFKYSKRDGTESAKMREISPEIVKDRFELINDLIKSKYEKFRDNIKEPLIVLFEKEIEKDIFEGYDQFYFPVRFKSKDIFDGYWHEIKDYNWRNFFN